MTSYVTTFEKNFKLNVKWSHIIPSETDEQWEILWTKKQEMGLFRYSLSIKKCKILDGRYRFLAQLNTDRATNRRLPVHINSVMEPFNSLNFNFLKIKDEEIMFKIKSTDGDKGDVNNVVVINVSPLENGHSLLIPSLESCLPQIVTAESLEFVIKVLLSSHSPAFRVGFNSLCAYASVNHLHYHAYYLHFPMLLEYIEVEPLIGNCYKLSQYPAKGYAFQISAYSEIKIIVRDIYKILEYFIQNEIAHNIYLTRGVSFEESSQENFRVHGERNVLRIYIWARSSSYGVKEVEAFNPAVCELFGHLVIKSEDTYQSVNEEEVTEVLREVTTNVFESTIEPVIRILKKKNIEK